MLYVPQGSTPAHAATLDWTSRLHAKQLTNQIKATFNNRSQGAVPGSEEATSSLYPTDYIKETLPTNTCVDTCAVDQLRNISLSPPCPVEKKEATLCVWMPASSHSITSSSRTFTVLLGTASLPPRCSRQQAVLL
ncbi:hypothetical protein EYF80_060796 [Liparis tanakae]|uniref:Uncharacterized protein n=1 Tax=Liparis tanakae TaxID=230148 RepID=A0A4Z2EJL8_9TELE|nr:hypothetical protein EYF80_060796 [Liparis tanakae]